MSRKDEGQYANILVCLCLEFLLATRAILTECQGLLRIWGSLF